MPTNAELGYLAGIIDGEGCILWHKNGSRKAYPRLVVKMTDLDVLEKCQAITKSGNIRVVSNIPEGYKPQWCWEVGKQAQVAGILMTIYSLVSVRRREKITEVLGLWKTQARERVT